MTVPVPVVAPIGVVVAIKVTPVFPMVIVPVVLVTLMPVLVARPLAIQVVELPIISFPLPATSPAIESKSASHAWTLVPMANPKLVRAVEVEVSSERLFDGCKKAATFCTEAVPNPRVEEVKVYVIV